ncbi:hypothetical protein LTR16_000206 [Cryomyces antarcticus]|uniref:DUF8004 domain-containing protein n=1 Tax=Cryomyces antarcticus TaxID=329879 RepID=A0ABR0M0G5_9PEZI|nr:hypothetical protein LTR16_000206 [Cryomyces antarcticus]
MCFARMMPEDIRSQSPVSSDASSASGSDGGLGAIRSASGRYELYIPAPEASMREEAFQWHITTRNFFAWMFGKPVVGGSLGKCLVDLLERIQLFRSDKADNLQDFMLYLQEMGYLDFAHCPDYSLALLYFAEHFELHDLWTDAFAHCVGMNETLCLSTEFEFISRVTKALITRAYLEMDLHLGRVARALSTFLEDDLSSTYLGLTNGARAHLDRFRSFLHSYYVEKFGYWPPPQGPTFSKSLHRSMYFEFQNLYDYLVDAESTDVLQNQTKLASGGICVLQNVGAFDQRHKYISLPHPLPLVPGYDDGEIKTQSQRALLAFKLGSRQAKTERGVTARTALLAATNKVQPSVYNCPLVKSYARFEREWVVKQEEKVSLSDARKVRWILIYGVLQSLISVTRAPKEVRDTEGPSYPLCCLVAGTPPWESGAKALITPAIPSINSSEDIMGLSDALKAQNSPESEPPSTPISIHPDCEQDYFSRTPFKGGPEYVANFTFPSRRSSILKSSAPSRTPSFREILVQGYGNGLNNASMDLPAHDPMTSEHEEEHRPSTLNLTVGCSTIPEMRTPTLEGFQLEAPEAPESPASGPISPMWSSENSSDKDDTDSSDYESGPLPDMDHASVCTSNVSSPKHSRYEGALLTYSRYENALLSKHDRNVSGASSLYPDAPTQAGDIDDFDMGKLPSSTHERTLSAALNKHARFSWRKSSSSKVLRLGNTDMDIHSALSLSSNDS